MKKPEAIEIIKNLDDKSLEAIATLLVQTKIPKEIPEDEDDMDWEWEIKSALNGLASFIRQFKKNPLA